MATDDMMNMTSRIGDDPAMEAPPQRDFTGYGETVGYAMTTAAAPTYPATMAGGGAGWAQPVAMLRDVKPAAPQEYPFKIVLTDGTVETVQGDSWNIRDSIGGAALIITKEHNWRQVVTGGYAPGEWKRFWQETVEEGL